MVPSSENLMGSYSKGNNNNVHKPRLSMESLQRTVSDISFQLITEEAINYTTTTSTALPPISEVEDAKCECCGMSEECTPEYISRVRDKFSGKLVCGLCAEAINEEMEKNGGKKEEALNEHTSACVRFNRFGRTHPVLYQAEAMREMLKKNCASRNIRAKSISPREKGKVASLARSSSCIPAITKEITDPTIVN